MAFACKSGNVLIIRKIKVEAGELCPKFGAKKKPSSRGLLTNHNLMKIDDLISSTKK